MDVIKFGIERVLYPYMEKRRGNRVRRFTGELLKSQNLAPGELAALRKDRLIQLLLHCAEHVPAYAFLKEADIVRDPYGALRGVKPLSKRDFKAHAPEHMADDAPQPGLIANRSGGSTGEPVHFYMDRQQVEQYEAARWRGLSWYGVTPGSRSLMVWGSSIELDAQARRAHVREDRWLKNREIISAYELSVSDGDRYIDHLNRYRPEYIYGYSTGITALCRAIEAAGVHTLKLRLKAVVTTSETLFPWQEEYIGEVFGCPVGNEYGARDAGILAYSCPCGGMHVSAENAVIEVLDPRTLEPVAEGESGILAVTDLCCRVQPRLRYMVGDTGSLLSSACSCGRTLPLMDRPEGREDALLLAENGRLVHGNFANQIIREYPQVKGFQLIQHTPRDASLLLAGLPEDIPAEKIAALISENLPGVELSVRFVEDIKPAASGKIRYSVREFDLSETLAGER